jgi:hypothetical protein
MMQRKQARSLHSGSTLASSAKYSLLYFLDWSLGILVLVLDHDKRVLHKKLSAALEEGKHTQLGSMNHTAVSTDTSTPAL